MTTPTHRRKRIRDAAMAALLAASTSAGSRIFSTRSVPWRRLQLPAVSVYALSETSDDQQTSPRELYRTLTLAIEAAVEAGENIDDTLDAMALELERAMHADSTLGEVCGDSMLVGTELEVAEQGDKPIGLLRLTYKCWYRTDAPDAEDQAPVDMETVDVQTSLGGKQAEADQAHDQLTQLDEVTP